MKILRMAGTVLIALLIAYLFVYSNRPRPVQHHESSATREEEACVVMRQRMIPLSF